MIPELYKQPFCAGPPLLSTVGKGPRGENGHSISIDVVDGDPYGFYRLQFKDSETGRILVTTPNMDPGSRIYLCNRNFEVNYGNDTFIANISDFTTEQLGSIRNARVGDLVIFRATIRTSDPNNPTVITYMNSIGVGVINSVSSSGVVTFTKHILLNVETPIPNGSITPQMLAPSTLEMIGQATQEQVDAWLEAHPEATTTVQDNSITTEKLHDGAVTNDKLANSVIMIAMTNSEIDQVLQN